MPWPPWVERLPVARALASARRQLQENDLRIARLEADYGAARAVAEEQADLRRRIQALEGQSLTLGRSISLLRSRMNETEDKVTSARDAERLAVARARRMADSAVPLVSITIPTYNRGPLLTERALPSCLAQSYANVEVIVVGDACTDDTAERIQAIGDPRVRFVNLPERGTYPTDATARWQVAGTVPANEAARMARGVWIAPLDDDDAFTPTHIEDLLAHAASTSAEMVYGITEMQEGDGTWSQVGEWPPRLAGLCRMAVMYRRDIGFFEHDVDAWKRDEPGDWNLWRRMQQAGVRMAFLPKVVATHYAERSQLGR